MKFAIEKEHRNYFNKFGWIGFEDIVSSRQLEMLNQWIKEALSQRLSISNERLHFSNAESLFANGHDLWRTNRELHHFIAQQRFGEIASDLFEQRPLRLGYDQFLPARYLQSDPFARSTVKKAYEEHLKTIASFSETSSFDEIFGGVIICLNEKKEGTIEKTDSKYPDIFPHLPGQATFFKASTPVDWSHIYSHVGQSFYVIVYTPNTTRYRIQPLDPHAHFLKHMGYIINDKLTDKLNPIIFR